MEAQPVFDRLTKTLDIGVDSHGANYWEDENAWVAGQTSITAFLCPSLPNTPPDGRIIDQIFLQPATDVSILWGYGWEPEIGLGLTHYQAVAGVYGETGGEYWGDHEGDSIGIYTTRSKTSAARIVDGMSKVLAFGEAPGTFGDGIEEESSRNGGFVFGIAWIGTATLPTVFGLDTSNENDSPNSGFVPNPLVTFWEPALGRNCAIRIRGWISTRTSKGHRPINHRGTIVHPRRRTRFGGTAIALYKGSKTCP